MAFLILTVKSSSVTTCCRRRLAVHVPVGVKDQVVRLVPLVGGQGREDAVITHPLGHKVVIAERLTVGSKRAFISTVVAICDADGITWRWAEVTVAGEDSVITWAWGGMGIRIARFSCGMDLSFKDNWIVQCWWILIRLLRCILKYHYLHHYYIGYFETL